MFRDHDENWNAPSVPGFRSFVESKNPEEKYPWLDSGKCACAQYSHSLGMTSANWIAEMKSQTFWGEMNTVARGAPLEDTEFGGKVHSQEWTFGKLLERIKEYETVD